VGYASLHIKAQPRFYKIKRVGAISALMVDPNHRRQGIGTLLLREARAYFRSKDLKYFTFYTSVENHVAIRLFKSFGVQPLQSVFIGTTAED
jgi:ribosomal protein S18 acetylase RimI-like enzyme